MEIETVSMLSYESRVQVCLRMKMETASMLSYENRNFKYAHL